MTRHARTGYRRCGASPPQLSSGPLAGNSALIHLHSFLKVASVRTKLVMSTNASLLLAHGVVLLFAPEVLFKLFNLSNTPETSVSAQFLSAALIGLGLMNWTARGLVLGGIYGRAIVYGNFAYSLIGFLASIKARLNGFSNDYFWIEIVLYLVFTIAFGVMLFRGPSAKTTEP